MNELAEFLKSERLRCDLPLEDLSGLSGISVSMLEAFERFDFERFGAAILLRKTVRGYCDCLHIDAQSLLEKYSAQIEACSAQDAGIRKYQKMQKSFYRRKRLVALPVFVFFISSVAVFYGGTWVSKRRSKLYDPPNATRIFSQDNLPSELRKLGAPRENSPVPKHDQQPSETSQSPEKSAAVAVETQKPLKGADGAAANRITLPEESSTAMASAPKADLAPLPPGNTAEEAMGGDGSEQNAEAHTLNKFTVEADGNVWIQVKIDGQKTHSEMLRAGDRREWVAAKNMEVVIGNAAGVQMRWNDQPLNAPHAAGRVLRFRLPDYANPSQG
ncbi:MAG: helix-turn-helix domain-containing protein [Syntrophobacteraceae bacterium]